MKDVATILCIMLIVYLFWIDPKKSSGVSNAIWIPFIWLLFSTARPISFWLGYWLHIGSSGGSSVEEGNAIEQFYTIALTLAGIFVLRARKINLQRLFTNNTWIWVFFVFAVFSFFWSDYPLVSFKRWVKTLGTVIMALVILTEEHPYETIGVILRRIAFIHLPLSVVFIKYYPGLGRFYHSHGGTINAGVAGYKNALGALCLISCIYFAWNLLFNRWQNSSSKQQLHYSTYLILLPMIGWLLYKANSATAIGCLAVSLSLLILARQHAFVQHPGRIVRLGVFFAVTFGILEFLIDADIKSFIISMLGRRPDLTTRVPMWEELLSMVQNPLAGFGFESFWLGERAAIIKEHWAISIQAHNGYLDMYLNLGYIGLFLVLAYILSGLKKVYHYLSVDYPNGVLRLCFLVVFVLWNWTENAFHLKSSMWLLLLFSIVDPPALRKTTTVMANELSSSGSRQGADSTLKEPPRLWK